MSDLAPADIAARVVAWHNRHPLARRLLLADVHSVGHVALPFHDPAAPPPAEAAPAAGSLRERAMARAREATPAAPAPAGAAPPPARPAPLRAAFHDDFIPPLSPTEVGAFAAQHGIERAAEPTGAPVRRVPPQPGGGGMAWRWVLTAELRAGGARTRVLLGAVPGAPVLGRRLWSLPRVGALAATGGAAAALALALGVLDGGGTPPPPVAVLPGATPTVAVPAAAASAPARTIDPVAVGAAGAGSASGATPAARAPAPDGALAAAAAASRPRDVEPQLGRVSLPPIAPLVDERRREAAERAAERAAAAAPAASDAPPAAAANATANPTSMPTRPPRATAAAATAAPAASAPVFALATRLLRTRTESQQIAEALSALLVVPGSPVQRVDIIPTGDDFRVVAWPYPGRAEAERAQAAMQARGHRLQLIAF